MNLLASRWGRLAAFFLLYVTEGIPLGFAAGAVSVWMRRDGVPPEQLGWFLGALYVPWGFKWVFGPIVDLIGSRRLGPRRGWILITQAIMVLGLLASATIDYTANLNLFAVALIAVFGVCAVQDVAIDAMAVGTLREEERGVGNGLMFAGAYVGQALGGSGMLYLSGATGSTFLTFLAVSAMIAAVWVIVALFVREETGTPQPPSDAAHVARAVVRYGVDVGRAMVVNKAAVAAAVFALLPASAMALGLGLSSVLQVELGLSDREIATLSLVGSVAAAAGSVLGGHISDRTGHRRTLAVYIALTAVPTAAMAWVLHQHGVVHVAVGGAARTVLPDVVRWFWGLVIVHGFFTGLTYGTRMAVFMKVCDPKVAATQFTAYMAAANLATSYSAAWQGSAVERWGFPTTLALDCAAGLACLLVLPLVRPREAEPVVAAAV